MGALQGTGHILSLDLADGYMKVNRYRMHHGMDSKDLCTSLCMCYTSLKTKKLK